MKKLFSFVAAAALVAGFASSCTVDSGDDLSARDQAFEAVGETFLANTVYPTYSSLADETEQLVKDLTAAQTSLTDANVKAACTTFLAARAQWELSEAFLFGAASDFGIDPHIDSWPLDEDAFNRLMASPNMLAALKGEDGAVYAGDNLGNALLGFHGIEYILFENGAAKSASKITSDQLTYAIAVAGDLRNRTAQLDVAWRGDSAPEARIKMVEEDLELNTTVAGGDYYYGANLLCAGKAGSTFRSWTHAMQSILQACADIADEVGTSKIGKAHTGEDVTYIESPYSQNSITDFYDNITSVKNVYFGGIESSRKESQSLHAWFAANDPATDTAVASAIDTALTKIKAMKAPFVNNIKDSSCDDAMTACSNLVDALESAIEALAQ